ncbi:MAG: ATP-binding protein, partial [Candidatus Absconditabacteria bacterium]
MIKIDKSKIPLISPNIDNIISDFYDDQIGKIDKIIYELKNFTGDNYLITGYRGTGKTTFVKYLESKIVDDENIFVYVDYPISKGYYVLLKQIIRKLFITVEESNFKNKEKKEELLNLMNELYLSTFNEVVKNRGTQYNNIISEEKILEIDMIELIIFINIFVSFFLIVFSNYLSIGSNNFFYIIFGINIIIILLKKFKNIVQLKKIIKEEKNIDNNFSINIKSYYDDDISENHLKDLLIDFRKQGFSLTFVIDELDKIEEEKDLNIIINSIKPLLLSGLANFIIISGQSLLCQIQRGMIESDKVINSLFSKNIHIPPFPISYFYRIIDNILEDNTKQTTDNPTLRSFLDALIFQSKGNLRSFIINFKKEIIWENGEPYLRLLEKSKYDNYSKIILIINDLELKHMFYYSSFIKDYLRELLYIWINKISIIKGQDFLIDNIVSINVNENNLNFDYISQYGDLVKSLGDIFFGELVNEGILEFRRFSLDPYIIKYKLNDNLNFNHTFSYVKNIEENFLQYFRVLEEIIEELSNNYGIKMLNDSDIVSYLKETFQKEIDPEIFKMRNDIAHGVKLDVKSKPIVNEFINNFSSLIDSILFKYSY